MRSSSPAIDVQLSTRLREVVRIQAPPVPPRGPASLFAGAEGPVDDATAVSRLASGEGVLLLGDTAPGGRRIAAAQAAAAAQDLVRTWRAEANAEVRT